MLGKLIPIWRRPSGASRNRVYLDPVEFQRELARERVRSMRRSYPFCVLLITHRTTGRRADDRRQRSVLAALLLRHTRWTDHKAALARDQFAVIFTDTPEMGGRVATDRLLGLFAGRDIDVHTQLRVYDPDGFAGPDDDDSGNGKVETAVPQFTTEGPVRRREDGFQDGFDDSGDGFIAEMHSSSELAGDGRRRGVSDRRTVSASDRRAVSMTDRRTDACSIATEDAVSVTQGFEGDVAVAVSEDRPQSETVSSLMTASLESSRDRRPVKRSSGHERPKRSRDRNRPSIDEVELDMVACTGKRSPMSHSIKRAVDVVGAGFGLIVTSPLIAAAVVAIRMHDGGPAFFRQTREGRHGRPFTILKLRTMEMDAESRQDALRSLSHRDGPAFKISNDPRVTPIGRFLRKTCLDELPQLINVFRGEMSLVGPRPLPWHESRKCNRWQRRRLDVRPGMTCYWQIQKASVESFDDWMRLDMQYLQHGNLLEDMRLIVQTVSVPILGRGSE